MFSRLRTNRKPSFHQRTDDERLLPAIELYEYPIGAITDTSPRACDASEIDLPDPERQLQICPYEILSFQWLRRIKTSPIFEKLGRHMDTLIRRHQQHMQSQWVILEDSKELAFCDAVETSSETPFRKMRGKCHVRLAKRRCGSDNGLRSTINWYFWSPEAEKNCPSLEFFLMHLAPTHIWL